MILLIGGEKGGSGKSCLAQNTAVYLAKECGASVMLVDCDPQRTSADWAQTRGNNSKLTKINCVQMYGKIRNDLLSLQKAYDIIIVDCGGQDSLALRATLSVANYAMLPLRPKRRDLKTVSHMDELLATCQMINPDLKAHFVITQCPSLPNQAKRIWEAKEVCKTWGIPVLEGVTYHRNVYDDSEESGLSVIEQDSEGKASDEIRSLVNELMEVSNTEELATRFREQREQLGRGTYAISGSKEKAAYAIA
ncbi:division plane positioning ATPase MipZ [Paraferrimonas haliotis]|nr:division plane positioning ATPase MipZ [Paraferrimonas haliotis]